VTYCNTEQYALTHCNTDPLPFGLQRPMLRKPSHSAPLQHTAMYRATLQHAATGCNTLQHTPVLSWVAEAGAQEAVSRYNTLQNIATHYDTLQHSAIHCNTDLSSLELRRPVLRKPSLPYELPWDVQQCLYTSHICTCIYIYARVNVHVCVM